MNAGPLSAPDLESLKSTARGNAALMISLARSQLDEAPVLTRAILRSILLSLLVPAEALARRLILILAARLARPAPRARPSVRPPPPPPPSAGAPPRAARAPAFRLTEPVPGARKPAAPGPLRPRSDARPPGGAPDDERLARNIFYRLDAVRRALLDPEAEALRFLRRLPPGKPARAPLAFGRPPGLADVPDPAAGRALTAADTEARAAWSRLSDTS